jgi:hypothetical protein
VPIDPRRPPWIRGAIDRAKWSTQSAQPALSADKARSSPHIRHNRYDRAQTALVRPKARLFSRHAISISLSERYVGKMGSDYSVDMRKSKPRKRMTIMSVFWGCATVCANKNGTAGGPRQLMIVKRPMGSDAVSVDSRCCCRKQGRSNCCHTVATLEEAASCFLAGPKRDSYYAGGQISEVRRCCQALSVSIKTLFLGACPRLRLTRLNATTRRPPRPSCHSSSAGTPARSRPLSVRGRSPESAPFRHETPMP